MLPYAQRGYCYGGCCADVCMGRYLSYKVAQILGSCHVPPVVPMSLSPGIAKLVSRSVYSSADPRGQGRYVSPCLVLARTSAHAWSRMVAVHVRSISRATSKGGPHKTTSMGVAVYAIVEPPRVMCCLRL